MANKIKMVFDNNYHGILTGHHGATRVGAEEGALAAYDMFLGGLAACLNHTFQSIVDKKKLTFHSVSYDIVGEKRKEVPTTLETVEVNVTIKGAEEGKEEQYEKAMDLATQYCSVYQTISKVSEMTTNITFK